MVNILFVVYLKIKTLDLGRLIMNNMNDMSVVKKQYATANNLIIRISIHDKYSTNKLGFGN